MRPMIALPFVAREARDYIERAGLRAEQQLAHYLGREFGDDPRVRLFFGLWLEVPKPGTTGHAAPPVDRFQMDVLALHRHGMAIIESKSVCEEVRINAHGEWTRTHKGKEKGMASPVEQARRQGEALRGLLRANDAQLRDKYVFGLLQGGFKYCPMELFVAISDKGRIVRAPGAEALVPQVMKADQIGARLRARLDQHRKGASLLSVFRRPAQKDDGMYEFREVEIERVSAFLLERHRG